jgi:hypothetical protein
MIVKSRPNGKFCSYRLDGFSGRYEHFAGYRALSVFRGYDLTLLTTNYTKFTNQHEKVRAADRRGLWPRREKVVGASCEPEYNGPMCSRECFSVSLGGLIAWLLVFLAAFLIGVAAVDAIERILLPEAPMANLLNNVEPVEIQQRTWEKDLHPLEITYDCSSTDGNQTRAIFTATNVGSEPIYFDLTIDSRYTAYFFDATGTSDRYVVVDISTKELAPGETQKISAKMPPGEKVYEYSLDYTAGSKHLRHRAFGSAGAAYWTCVSPNVPESVREIDSGLN